MNKQKNMFQMKEQDRISRKELREMQISNFQLRIQSNYNDAHWT